MESIKPAEDAKKTNLNSGKRENWKLKKTGNKTKPKMREVRQRAVAVLCPKVTKIAKALAKLAEEGNCQAAKLVFEFLGIFPPAQAGEEDEDDTLARYLLRELGIPDHPTEEEVAKVLGETRGANADAVESS